MKAKLIIEGKEIEIEISEEEYKKLQPSEEKKTGYERVTEDNVFYYVSDRGDIEIGDDSFGFIDEEYYDVANYYSSEIVAENNARADKLVRQLRRFAVEHREDGGNFSDINTAKFYIYYDYTTYKLEIGSAFSSEVFGTIHFDSKGAIQAAIDEFHNELIWYFTEYRDSL